MNKKINILFIIDYLYGFAGTERHLLQVVTHLNRDLFSCFVCTLYKKHERMLQAFAAADCEIFHLGIERMYDLHAIKKLFTLVKFTKKIKPDIVQTFHFGSDTYGALAALLAGVPMIISSRRDTGYYRTGRRRIASGLAMKACQHLIAACDAIKEQVIRDEKVSHSRIKTIYNGVDLSLLKEIGPDKKQKMRCDLGIPSNAFVIGNVSHFRPEKGHQYFFEAAGKIRPLIKNLKVLAIGFPESYGSLEKVRECSGLGDELILPGYVTNVSDYVSVMDVACLTPIENEGFSNAILEKMALGKPVVATDVGGNAEAIENGVSGYIVPPRDAGALAEALLRLYQNPELRHVMGKQARLRIEKHFTIPKMISEMEQFYLALSSGKRLNGKPQ